MSIDKVELYKSIVFDHVHEFEPRMEFIYEYQQSKKRYIIYALGHSLYHTRLHIHDISDEDKEYHFYVSHFMHKFKLLEDKLQLLGFIRDLYP